MTTTTEEPQAPTAIVHVVVVDAICILGAHTSIAVIKVRIRVGVNCPYLTL